MKSRIRRRISAVFRPCKQDEQYGGTENGGRSINEMTQTTEKQKVQPSLEDSKK
jgi:hypothetical protein